MKSKAAKGYGIYFALITLVNIVFGIISKNYIYSAGSLVWGLVIVFSFVRKEYKSLTFLWVLKVIGLCLQLFVTVQMLMSGKFNADYVAVALSIVDTVWLKIAIVTDKKATN
ncbi:MAG: hypothetical protein RSC09_02150 [Clostridia bacterium]